MTSLHRVIQRIKPMKIANFIHAFYDKNQYEIMASTPKTYDTPDLK